jgi:3D (Asp-Asp-Asp) domain-containing protein
MASLTGLLVVIAGSAVVTKELTARNPAPALAMIAPSDGPGLSRPLPDPRAARADAGNPVAIADPLLTIVPENPAQPEAGAVIEATEYALPEGLVADTSIRYFNGRPVKPIKQIWMTVTAYSPDWRSCGDSADNITASNHHVETNAHRLVAADTRILPLGSMISIPGYDQGQIVPVLDRGGAIKGMRLDVLYATHEQARKWGVQKLPITVWGYADGEPACDYRKERDSRR